MTNAIKPFAILALCIFGVTAPALAHPAAFQSAPPTRELIAIPYPADNEIQVELRGTERLPDAEGEAEVERREGITRIELELDNMKRASMFGGDFNTYVAWAASPEGQVENLGEVIIDGDEAEVNLSTSLDAFALFITAEPHFLVDRSSRMIVVENIRVDDGDLRGGFETARIVHSAYEANYAQSRETLADVDESSGIARTDMEQAATAIRLAAEAGAPTLAADEFDEAQRAYERAEGASNVEDVEPSEVATLARRATRLAATAHGLAVDRAFEAALAAEREGYASLISELEQRLDDAADEAERARVRAELNALQLEIEEAARENAMIREAEALREAAAERAERTEAERTAAEARLQAEAEQRRAQGLARTAEELAAARSEAEREAADARAEATRARAERDAAFAQMREALDRITETRETTRGLIVNIPDVLFDFDRATLRPEGRERLSRIAGVLLATDPDLRLEIEGHTDNVGSDAYNLTLSEERARAVEDYLLGNGVPANMIESAEGFGESRPLATNETNEGRQRNRRVEIVIDTTMSSGPDR